MKNYYLIKTTNMDDAIYYVFTNEVYYDAFAKCIEWLNDYNMSAIKRYIKDCRNNGLFAWIANEQLEDDDFYEDILTAFESEYEEYFEIKDVVNYVKDGKIKEEFETILL